MLESAPAGRRPADAGTLGDICKISQKQKKSMRAQASSLAFFILLSWAGKASAEEPIPEWLGNSNVVMRDPSSPGFKQQSHAWLIPARLLATPYESWSRGAQVMVPREVLARFDQQIDGTRNVGGSGKCSLRLDSKSSSTTMDPDVRFSLFQVAGDKKSIVHAEIIGSEPAWDAMSREIATLVHVKVLNVLQKRDPIVVGDILTFRRPWGSLTVRGITLCTEDAELQAAPTRESTGTTERLRQEILLLGRISGGNSSFLDTGDYEVFPVVEGKVLYPTGFSYYRDLKPERLESVITYFSAGPLSNG